MKGEKTKLEGLLSDCIRFLACFLITKNFTPFVSCGVATTKPPRWPLTLCYWLPRFFGMRRPYAIFPVKPKQCNLSLRKMTWSKQNSLSDIFQCPYVIYFASLGVSSFYNLFLFGVLLASTIYPTTHTRPPTYGPCTDQHRKQDFTFIKLIHSCNYYLLLIQAMWLRAAHK